MSQTIFYFLFLNRRTSLRELHATKYIVQQSSLLSNFYRQLTSLQNQLSNSTILFKKKKSIIK